MFLKNFLFLLTSIYSSGVMNGWCLDLTIFCWIQEGLFDLYFLNIVKCLLSFLILNIRTQFMLIVSFFTLWRSRNGTAWRLLWNTQIIHKFWTKNHLKAFIFIIIFSRRIWRRYFGRLRRISKAFSE